MPILELNSLHVGYGKTPVLWDISLEIGPGEIIALVGSNGAGKTTLLRALSGVLPVSSGRILWKGKDITRVSSSARVESGLVHVPEGRHVFYGLSVRDNLLLGSYTKKLDRAAVSKYLQWIYCLFPELARRQNHLAGLLSGGEQQMCAIGRGLMAHPQLLLIDEMSLGLAPVVVERMLPSIQQVVDERGVAVLLVDQDVELAFEIAKRGYVLENGRIMMRGDANELRQSGEIIQRYLTL